MVRCKKVPGINCLECNREERRFSIVDMEMPGNIGGKMLAVECRFLEGCLALDLSPEQINEITCGKKNNLFSIDAGSAHLYLSQSKVSGFVGNNKFQIKLIFLKEK